MPKLIQANPPPQPPFVLIPTDYVGISNGPPMYSPNLMGCVLLVLNGGEKHAVGSVAHVSPGDDQLARCTATLASMIAELKLQFNAPRAELQLLVAGGFRPNANFVQGMCEHVAEFGIDQTVFDWRTAMGKRGGLIHGEGQPGMDRGQATAVYYYPGTGVYQTYFPPRVLTHPPEMAKGNEVNGVTVMPLEKFVPGLPR